MANVHWDNIFLDIARHWITNKESDDIKAYHDIACDYDIAILRNNLTEDICRAPAVEYAIDTFKRGIK